MISKLEENLGDTDIKNFTVSPLYQIKCIYAGNPSVEVSASDAEWPTNSRNLIGNGEAVRDLDRLGGRDELGREGLRRGRHVPPEAGRGRSLG